MKHSREEALTLGVLEAVGTRQDLTQRHLADKLGVALGLANSYLRRCVRKGLVKIQQAPANRYLYYLTPQGFAEKSRLTAAYLAASLDFYHGAGASLTACYAAMAAAGHRRVLFAGMSELAEIASVRAHDHDVELVGTWDGGATVARFLGHPVWRALAEAAPHDAVLFTDMAAPGATWAALQALVPTERLYLPSVLGFVREMPAGS
jgi:DNA-binding MarR family transcriptional regulator